MDGIQEKLSKISLFKELKENKPAMDAVAGICRMKQFSGGQTIFKEGESGDDMFIVYSGAVEIQKQTRAGDSYTVVQLDAAQNVFFGELALVDNDSRSATVIAKRDCEFLVIAKKDFIQLGNKEPSIGLAVTREIAGILASRLRKTTQDMLTIFDALVQEIQA